MSAHVLLYLLKELGKRDKLRGLQSICFFFATGLINSMNDRFYMYLSYDIKLIKFAMYQTCINVSNLNQHKISFSTT